VVLIDLDADPDERDGLLMASDIVTINGARRLRLKDEDRAAFLAAARGRASFEDILRDARIDDRRREGPDRDPVRGPSAWLRRFLAGEVSGLEGAPPWELKAALEGRKCLRLVDDLPTGVPPLADLLRRVEMAELLEPLRLLVGAQGGWGGQPRSDRFVGREADLSRLRSFVDELPSPRVWERFVRWLQRAVRPFTGSLPPGAMTIEGPGGLGKSTLLAKFVLDHALGQVRPFPFAYLDFDRAGIDPDRPRQLLIEIARQVRLQFHDATEALDRLIEDIRAEQVDRPSGLESMAESIKDPFSRFVEILREHATHGDRAFLVVLDTLEVVQWSMPTMERITELVDEFRRKDLYELKLVASGRADVPELRRARGLNVPSLHETLRPLSVDDAMKMATALGRGAMGGDWKEAWSAAIAGGESDDESRREPLAVRVAVDLLVQCESDRDALARTIRDGRVGENSDFVAWLYQKRILEHVRHPLARKLAWPGLVVRRVTKEIARELLAGLCEISPEDAERAFNALGQEIWMVTREGDALRHRPDLRARTLPLMRKKDPTRFDQVASAAVAYYGSRRQRSREDRVEWIYHRLLVGENPVDVARDTDASTLSLLAPSEADFPPDSPAASYLASRTASQRLSERRISELSAPDALYHLILTSPDSFALNDVELDRTILAVADRIGDVDRPVENEGWARALWIKTGAWRRLTPEAEVAEGLTRQALLAHVFWAARVAPMLDEGRRTRLFRHYQQLATPAPTDDNLPMQTGVQMMAFARVVGSDAFGALDANVDRILAQVKPIPLPSVQAALRTAIVLGKTCRKSALRLWLDSRRRGASERVLDLTVSQASLEELIRVRPDAEGLLDDYELGRPGTPRRISDETIVAGVRRLLDDMLDDMTEDAEGRGLQDAISRAFARRDEDWIVPIGYAAARAGQGRPSKAVSRQLTGYVPAMKGARKPAPTFDPPSDAVAAIRLADEAGDLTGLARLFLHESKPNQRARAELRFLLECHGAWSDAVTGAIGTEPSSGAGRATSVVAERPPEPGPVLDREDPQKGRWGGRDNHDGRAAWAVIDSVEGDVFYFSVVVESTDGSELEPPVVFHLHDSYPRSVVTIRRITDGKQARLSEWESYGVFAIGIQVKNAAGRWVALELDLAKTKGLPKRFLDK
jgi:hypothetical protein